MYYINDLYKKIATKIKGIPMRIPIAFTKACKRGVGNTFQNKMATPQGDICSFKRSVMFGMWGYC